MNSEQNKAGHTNFIASNEGPERLQAAGKLMPKAQELNNIEEDIKPSSQGMFAESFAGNFGDEDEPMEQKSWALAIAQAREKIYTPINSGRAPIHSVSLNL
jgi:hypothetical protein